MRFNASKDILGGMLPLFQIEIDDRKKECCIKVPIRSNIYIYLYSLLTRSKKKKRGIELRYSIDEHVPRGNCVIDWIPVGELTHCIYLPYIHRTPSAKLLLSAKRAPRRHTDKLPVTLLPTDLQPVLLAR